jgi:hypothetical protein
METTNKWIKYCIDNAEEISEFVAKVKDQMSLTRVGSIIDLEIPEAYRDFNNMT